MKKLIQSVHAYAWVNYVVLTQNNTVLFVVLLVANDKKRNE